MTVQTDWPIQMILPISCSVHWKSSTRTESSNARQICSPNGPSSPIRQWPWWIRQVKHWRCPSQKKPAWIWTIWPAYRKNKRRTGTELRGVIFRDTGTVGRIRKAPLVTCRSSTFRQCAPQTPSGAAGGTAETPVYQVNVEALRAAQPKDLDASEIEVRLGATWIDKEYIQQFMYETFNTPSLSAAHYGGQLFVLYRCVADQAAKSSDILQRCRRLWNAYGTDCASAYEDFGGLPGTSRDVQVYDTIEDADGKERRVLNTKEPTLAAQSSRRSGKPFGTGSGETRSAAKHWCVSTMKK